MDDVSNIFQIIQLTIERATPINIFSELSVNDLATN